MIEGKPPGASVGSKLLGVLGVAQPGGFRLRIDPARVPKAEALRSQLFPSVLATAADDQGVRLIAREAVPFACTAPGFRYDGNTGTGETITVQFNLFPFPTARLDITRNSKTRHGRFTFGMFGRFVPSDE